MSCKLQYTIKMHLQPVQCHCMTVKLSYCAVILVDRQNRMEWNEGHSTGHLTYSMYVSGMVFMSFPIHPVPQISLQTNKSSFQSIPRIFGEQKTNELFKLKLSHRLSLMFFNSFRSSVAYQRKISKFRSWCSAFVSCYSL